MRRASPFVVVAGLLLLLRCGGEAPPAGTLDAGSGVDAGVEGVVDGGGNGTLDDGGTDAGFPPDAGFPADAGFADAGFSDGGFAGDAGFPADAGFGAPYTDDDDCTTPDVCTLAANGAGGLGGFCATPT